jgi:hypothetical protein
LPPKRSVPARAAAGRVGRLGLVFAVVLSVPLAAAAINLRSLLLALG